MMLNAYTLTTSIQKMNVAKDGYNVRVVKIGHMMPVQESKMMKRCLFAIYAATNNTSFVCIIL